ncbi:MAG: HAMP domain-containing protein [Saccharothrix sp.]|nr:HAMP domain-containing protein [Saccharothrix sp.]
MTAPRLSVRARLTAWYGGFFLLTGVVLVTLNYLLASSQLPDVETYVSTPDGGRTVPGWPLSPAAVEALAEYRSSALRTLLVQSGVGLLLATAFAGVVGWLMAGRVLAPLHAITATAHRLEAEDLGQRIDLDGPDDELKELADTFDGMLDRLATAFDSQKRFVANASHELRNPLAVQRTLVEVALDDPHASADVRRLGEQLLVTNARSERLIDGLLLLARSDRGLTRRDPVRLDLLVDQALREAALGEGRYFGSDLEPLEVPGDHVLLMHLVGNLVSNAIVHNHLGGNVSVRVRGHGRPALVVANTGPTLPDDVVPSLFEPFRRMPGATTPGAGLGLSIVRSIAHAHQGSVTAQAIPGGGLAVEVNLPVTDVRTPPTYGKIT